MPTPRKRWPNEQEYRRKEAEDLAKAQQKLINQLSRAKSKEEYDHLLTKIELNSLRIEKLMIEAKHGE